jgi:hypothetical protein
VRSFLPATIGRPTAKLPAGRYRRRMKQRLNKGYGGYGQRWQAETGFSMFKRRLGATVNGRSYWSQCRDLLLMAITYNLMLLYALAAFLQSRLRPLFRPFFVHPQLELCYCVTMPGHARRITSRESRAVSSLSPWPTRTVLPSKSKASKLWETSK